MECERCSRHVPTQAGLGRPAPPAKEEALRAAGPAVLCKSSSRGKVHWLLETRPGGLPAGHTRAEPGPAGKQRGDNKRGGKAGAQRREGARVE